MNATEIIERDVKHNGIGHVRQRLAICVRQAREAAKVHSHVKVGALDVRGRDAAEIRSADFDVWDCRHNITAAVPPIASAAGIDFPKLREIDVLPKVLSHGAHIGVVLVACDLVAAIGTVAEIGRKRMGIDAGAPANEVRNDELAFAVERKPNHRTAPIRGIPFMQMGLPRVDIAPHFIYLHVPGADVLHSGVKHPAGLIRCRVHQRQNRVAVHFGEPFDCANAHSFQHQGKNLCGGFRRGVVGSELGFVLGKRNFAGRATIPLNVALSVAPELAGRVVTAFAGHVISPLALSGETSHNKGSWSEAWSTPRFGLAPQPVDAGSGALSVTGYGLWWANGNIHHGAASSEHDLNCYGHCSFLSLTAPASCSRWGGSYLLPKSFLAEPRRWFGDRIKRLSYPARGISHRLSGMAFHCQQFTLFLQPLERVVNNAHRIGVVQLNTSGSERVPDLRRSHGRFRCAKYMPDGFGNPGLIQYFSCRFPFGFGRVIGRFLQQRGQRFYGSHELRHALVDCSSLLSQSSQFLIGRVQSLSEVLIVHAITYIFLESTMSRKKCNTRRNMWEESIAEAHKKLALGRAYIAKMKSVIRVLEQKRASGELWPGVQELDRKRQANG